MALIPQVTPNLTPKDKRGSLHTAAIIVADISNIKIVKINLTMFIIVVIFNCYQYQLPYRMEHQFPRSQRVCQGEEAPA